MSREKKNSSHLVNLGVYNKDILFQFAQSEQRQYQEAVQCHNNELFEYIETFYNTTRIHSHCMMKSPYELEEECEFKKVI